MDDDARVSSPERPASVEPSYVSAWSSQAPRRSPRKLPKTAREGKTSWKIASSQRRAIARGVLRDDGALRGIARAAMATCDPFSRACGFTRARARVGVGRRRVRASADSSCDDAATKTVEREGVRLRYQGDWLDVKGSGIGTVSARECLERWRASPFEAYGGQRKDCRWVACIASGDSGAREGVRMAIEEVAREYEGCSLGVMRAIGDRDASYGVFDVGDVSSSALERYASSFGAAATTMAEFSATRPTMCVMFVIIPDQCDEADALTILALASHVAAEVTRSIHRSFLSISVQAIPASWCEDARVRSSASVRMIAFGVFSKLARPTVKRAVQLPNDDMHQEPTSGTNVEKTDGRCGVCGAAVIGRRAPHPMFHIPETATGRRISSFPAYEPLYALTPRASTELSTTRGLHCAYIIVAGRWVVASWSDSYGEFFTLEAEPFENEREVETSGLPWLLKRTSELSEQLAFAYGKKASSTLYFERAVVCRLGECSARERDALENACASAPAPLDRSSLTRVELTCVEPDLVPARVAVLGPRSTSDVVYVLESNQSTMAVKTFALPPSAQGVSIVAHSTKASSSLLRALSAEGADLATLESLASLYGAQMSQLGMMCASDNVVDEHGNVRAPFSYHAEACTRFASAIQSLEVFDSTF